MQSIARYRLLRFLVVGGVAYVVNQALLALLYDGALASMSRGSGFDAPLLLASAVALEVSILVRFALNDVWTFRDRHGKSLAARFCQSNFTSFGSPVICLAAVNVLTPVFGVSYLISNSLAIILGLAWNWLWSVRWVWKADRRVSSRRPGYPPSFIRLERPKATPAAATAPSAAWVSARAGATGDSAARLGPPAPSAVRSNMRWVPSSRACVRPSDALWHPDYPFGGAPDRAADRPH
jgi:putative flippase GtrA